LHDTVTGAVEVAKVPSTGVAADDGVLQALAATHVAHNLHEVTHFVHGTTIGLNTLLERSGANVALLCTRGFRDILELRAGNRDNPFDLFWKPPTPLVPRELRFPVLERVDANGRVVQVLDEEEVLATAAVLRDSGVESVAIAFLNAYANPDNERRAAELLRVGGFMGEISTSCEVSRSHREYERTSTAVIDAYVRPRMSQYLQRLAGRMAEGGFEGTALIMRSGGGGMSFGEASRHPSAAIMSGPAGAAEGAAALGRSLGISDAVVIDVGGTSSDVSLIRDGGLVIMSSGVIEGLPVQTPWIDIRTVGAGGGSIAWVDQGGLLCVGPESSGADPGPACYGRGGVSPTVTDAAHFLGMLGFGRLAGGIELDGDLAERAIASVAGVLGTSSEHAARGIVSLATTRMANAIREVTIERGEDPRESALVAVGGAGPLFATALADELEISTIIVPAHPGNFSAQGLLVVDMTQTVEISTVMPLNQAAIDVINTRLPLEFIALESKQGRNDAYAEVQRSVILDLRYRGQDHSVGVDIETAGDRIPIPAEGVACIFEQKYLARYGVKLGEDVELVSVQLMVRRTLNGHNGNRDAAVQVPHASQTHTTTSVRTVSCYSSRMAKRIPFPVVERATLTSGHAVDGPVILTEPTSTTYVDAGFRARSGGDVLWLTARPA
jgi:N-methylhydantoinase A